MNLIDHIIIIPASPQHIWAYLRDLNNNPQWQENCTYVSFITTHHHGIGTRWRYTGGGGQDYVAEITAWYENLGYEYIIVDGVTFEENKGRIRLQELAEGTRVQWTFSYTTGGMLGGLRNSLSIKRSLQNHIKNSLRSLHSQVIAQSEVAGMYESKSSLREAPDADERAQYQSPYDTGLEPMQAPAEPAIIIPEPPLAEDDTRPNPAVQPEPADPLEEPTFLSSVPSVAESDAPEDDTLSRRSAALAADKPDVEKAESTQERTQEIQKPPIEAETSSNLDTARISVFDVFGVDKPSETQQMKAVVVEEDGGDEIPLEQQSTSPERTQEIVSGREGYRQSRRKKKTEIRHVK